MKFKSVLIRHSSGGHYIYFSKEIGDAFREKYGKRAICQIENGPRFHCAVQPRKEGGYYIGVGKRILTGTEIQAGDELGIHLLEDKTEFQAQMPEELIAVLETDPEARAIFDQLSDGKKRSAIFMISKAKRSETRINRALKLVEKWKMGELNPQKWLRK